jgi:vacuolar-type H+-ATPase subunit I/STV1
MSTRKSSDYVSPEDPTLDAALGAVAFGGSTFLGAQGLHHLAGKSEPGLLQGMQQSLETLKTQIENGEPAGQSLTDKATDTLGTLEENLKGLKESVEALEPLAKSGEPPTITFLKETVGRLSESNIEQIKSNFSEDLGNKLADAREMLEKGANEKQVKDIGATVSTLLLKQQSKFEEFEKSLDNLSNTISEAGEELAGAQKETMDELGNTLEEMQNQLDKLESAQTMSNTTKGLIIGATALAAVGGGLFAWSRAKDQQAQHEQQLAEHKQEAAAAAAPPPLPMLPQQAAASAPGSFAERYAPPQQRAASYRELAEAAPAPAPITR